MINKEQKNKQIEKNIKKSFITVIGGTNIDILAKSYNKIKNRDSNPGEVSISFGGVGRNIADNLSKLKQDVNLITVLGDDFNSEEIKRNCEYLGIDISNSLIIPNSTTSTYISILDDKNDMKLAISAMDLYDQFDVEFIKSKKNIIEKSSLCIIDTNIPKETIEYIVENFNVPVFLDLVSTTKALKVKDFIGKFHTIKPNVIEAEVVSGIRIHDDKSLKECVDYFISLGVKQVFISLGSQGSFYSNGNQYGMMKSFKTKVMNTTGAGDAFMAGIAYSFEKNLSIIESCKNGTACAALAISSIKTINEDLSLKNIEKIKEENL